MKALKVAKIGYKSVTLLQFIELLTNNYEVTTEERTAVKKIIAEPCGPTHHIKIMYDHVKEGLEALANIKYNVGYQQEEFIETGYMAI